ncbi:UNVERIFIED_CONTAM: putative GEM-like protein 8 [Sesamum latifolium]|uniref:GEM-like protein 8 n=1 Tax=Sesamum latifolium TaxID=2727402 RepID=A0AAW2WXW5_9LAMI
MQLKKGSGMEPKHSKSRIGTSKRGFGVPNGSSQYAVSVKSTGERALLPDPAAHQCQLLPSPSRHYSKIRHGRADSVIAKMMRLGESMDVFAQGIREHVRLGPKLSETVKGKLSLGARILQVGGVEKVFKQKFNVGDDEKLLKASQCYLSTTAGPIAGILFVSNNRVAFCSERSIKLSSPTGKLLKAHYKVMIPLRKIKRAAESENVKKPTQKYVQIVTEDNFEFWFMGFLNHRSTLKYLQQAIHDAR